MKKIIFLGFSLLITFLTFGQTIFPEPLSQRIANYNIDVELNTENKLLTGEMLLEWKNTSLDTISELQFHMYMNAFKDRNSTFMQEITYHSPEIENWGWIDIISMQIEKGEDLTDKIKYIHPDDNNQLDNTVISVQLKENINPLNSAKIKIKFIVKLPEIIARTGFADDYFFVGQWFPKIGVLEHKGMRNVSKTQWNCHQFHANSEFYADFGVYNVKITLPENYKVGATGVLIEEIYNKNKTKTLTYRAEDVIDFAWTAYDNFIEEERKWQDITVKLLIPKEHKRFAERHFSAAFESLDFLNDNIGSYPYPNLTIVSTPFKGLNSAGMEYPCLVTTASICGMPSFVKIPELTTVHEITHNYFMAMLASNEFEEPWLDEGLTSYVEAKIMDNRSPIFDLMGLNIFDFESKRAMYTGYKYKSTTSSAEYSWNYTGHSYGIFAYEKPATFLKTLENIVGEKAMNKILRTYFDRWKFKHPGASDFIAIVNEVVKKEHGNTFGKDMNWFFQQTLYGTGICDYELAKIKNTQLIENKTKTHKKKQLRVTYKRKNKSERKYLSEITVLRNGEVQMPLEILVTFENGTSVVEKWNGAERSKTFTYKGELKIVSAKVDYLDKITIDINRNNNSLTLKPDNRPIYKWTVKFMFFIQNILQTASYFA